MSPSRFADAAGGIVLEVLMSGAKTIDLIVLTTPKELDLSI